MPYHTALASPLRGQHWWEVPESSSGSGQPHLQAGLAELHTLSTSLCGSDCMNIALTVASACHPGMKSACSLSNIASSGGELPHNHKLLSLWTRATEISMKKNTIVQSKYYNAHRETFCVFHHQKHETWYKGPSSFHGSHDLPQPTTASHMAAHTPPSSSLTLCMTAPAALNLRITLIYYLQLCTKRLIHYTVLTKVFSYLLARCVFPIHVRKFSQVVSRGKKMFFQKTAQITELAMSDTVATV